MTKREVSFTLTFLNFNVNFGYKIIPKFIQNKPGHLVSISIEEFVF